jgi:glutathione S-transferase
VIPHHRRASDEATRATVTWGQDQSKRWLAVLDSHFLRHAKRYLLGDRLSIADFFGGSIVSLGMLVGCEFEGFPNVQRWCEALNELDSWRGVNVGFREFARSLQDNRFVALHVEHARAA